MPRTAGHREEDEHRVPVIVIAGHLGAGKTSLLNRLLHRPGARLGVVVNDFGRLNVDAALVAGQVDEAAAISGGCLCCLPDAGGLDEALERLARPRLRLDAIVVEASGAADPLALARLVRYSGVERVRPGGLVEVVDAVEHFRTVDVRPDPPAHHAVATLVVVSKADLLPEPERQDAVARITERVRTRNASVPVLVAPHGRIDPALVFDVASDHEPADELPLAALLRDEARERDDDRPAHVHAHAASVVLRGPVSPSALLDLLESPPAGAYRIKGRVAVRGPRGMQGHLVNLVGRMIHVSRLPTAPERGELVAIGPTLDEPTALGALSATRDAPADRPDPAGLRRLQRYRRLSA